MAIILILLPSLSSAETIVKEKVISNKQTWTAAESPFVVRHDVLVESSGDLTIEPGVDVHFSPEVGITVRGVLVADGLEDRKIRDVFVRSLSSKQCCIPYTTWAIRFISSFFFANELISNMYHMARVRRVQNFALLSFLWCIQCHPVDPSWRRKIAVFVLNKQEIFLQL